MNYFGSYLIDFDSFLHFGFYLFGCCNFAVDWLNSCLGTGYFVDCGFRNCSCDWFDSPSFDFLANRIDLSNFVDCCSLGFDLNILDNFVPDSLIFDSLGCMLVDCNTLVELVRSLVEVVVVELLQLQFSVASAKLLDFGLSADLTGQLAFVAVV